MFGKSEVNVNADFKKTDGQTNTLTEEALLWTAFKDGDQQAFSRLYYKYYRPLYNYGYTLFPEKELLKDTLQELFFEIWRDRQKLGQVYSVKLYLLTSFRRKLIYKINQQRKRNTFTHTNVLQQESYEAELILTQTEVAQQTRLQQEMDKLPQRQKEALYLRFYQELSYQQITEIMKLQYQTVRDLVHKALKTLREKLRSATFPLHMMLVLAFSLPAFLGL
ncbi:sigma-70 family RNA polymerase sigma factor [Cytophagaceae bacterium DM2B3-1]|uniref:Sigma-70 family RNA polymerase sigma factor n=1 Tax=Xanthocytophaga flava TaxID=3048013 RepID=A0ABT7CXG0_9BACT|nr:sigma-70 family RNA polymerase sigma factor [Xanthocytophaga flavus]MDJ1466764.1 sigma-70 family RNA polymerase sigma factor [Xanthocytophaga flavus]MDJ1498450.1 sigma-70 family RNA polymerase sigma factor [Xanthocytophaga flavus]